MADLIPDDYSGWMAAGGLVKGFSKGLMDAEELADRREDRKFKRMEFEAKMRADQTAKDQKLKQDQYERSWKDKQMRADMRGKGFLVPKEGQDFDPGQAQRDPKWVEEQTGLRQAGAGGLAVTPGQKSTDTTFGKEYADYQAGGGRATVDKNLGLLSGAIKDLEAPGELSGGISGAAPEIAQDYVNPKLASVRDKVRSAIQGTLKQVLAGQYTEREGQDIFNRAFNPRLSDEENVRRAKAELQSLTNMAADKDAAARYFEQKGTLNGFRPAQKKLAAEPQGLLDAQPQGLVPAASAEQKEKARLEELRRKARGG